MNTQETTLRQEASDVGGTALDKGSTATRGSHRDSESLEDSDTEDFSQLETVRAQTRDTSKECSAIFWRSQDPSCCD